MRVHPSVQFDHERLTVYRRALEFLIVAAQVAAKEIPPSCGFLGDPLRRAASSIAFDIAEGAGEYRPKEKARFYRMARRSATECASILDALRIWPRTNDELRNAQGRDLSLAQGREQLIEVVSMLAKMARRFDDST